MALDKQFLKYKLEKIKNDDIYKDLDSATKKRMRKKNSAVAQKEADAIHSYLTGMDPIKIFSNKSFLEPDSMPGNLALSDKNQLNVIQVEPPKVKITKMTALMRKFLGLGAANKDRGRKLKLLKKVFDSLNIIFGRNKISMDKDFEVKGTTEVGKDLNVLGIHSVASALNVMGPATFRGGIELAPRGMGPGMGRPTDLMVTGDLNCDQNIEVGGNLNVIGNETLTGDITVTGNEIISGNAQVDKNHLVKKNLVVDNSLTIGRNSNLKGNLNVRMNSNTFGIHNVGLGLNVMGLTILGGGVLIAPIPLPPIPGLPPKKSSTNLKVQGDTRTENLQVDKDSEVLGNSVIRGSIKVQGPTDLLSETTARADVTVQGDVGVGGDLSVDGDTNVGGILNVGESVADVNGYTYLPNGILLQWGTDTRAEDGAFVISFPTSFPNACFSVTVNRQAGNGADDHKTYAVTATIITTTGFTIDRDDDIHGEDSINWIAVGN
jgi:hypothetical protein